MYERDFADIYDIVCGAQRDYADQAAKIRDVVLSRNPSARTLLDVGCGTGEGMLHLRDTFEVTGVDLSRPMVEAARGKLPDLPVHQGDMRDFRLGRTYDAVCCMYSSIGYLADEDGLGRTADTFARHLAPGGVLLVEPWFLPEQWNGGDLVSGSTDTEGVRISRMGRWHTSGDHCSVEMHYLVGEGSGVRHFIDRQTLTLFTKEAYVRAFARVGIELSYTADHLDRGLFVGRHAAG